MVSMKKSCDIAGKPFEISSEPYNIGLPPEGFPSIGEKYDGPLFDAHLHLVGTDSEEHRRARDDKLFINPKNAKKTFVMMKNQGVIGMFGFLPVIHEYFIPDPNFNDDTHEDALTVLARCDNIITPFLYPYSHIGIPPAEHGRKLPKLVQKIHSESEITFLGIGEIHTEYPQTDSYDGMQLTDPAILEMYDYAAESGLIVMIHPQERDIEDIRAALAHNDKTIFLFHGLERAEKFLPALFEEFDNVYFSLDANLLEDYTLAHQGMTKEKFLNNLQSNKIYYKILASALDHWKPFIEAYPDRIMWGTDALWTWHFEEEVYGEIVWFGRTFIGGLDEAIQENFAHKNAEKLIQGR